jgi:TPR repeat protein
MNQGTLNRMWHRSRRALVCALAAGIPFVPPTAAQSLDDALRAIEAGRHSQAAEWLLPLANGGIPAAQYRLGNLYYHGQGVIEDETMAVYWWKKAAAYGHSDSMFQLASAYLFGAEAARYVADPDREAAVWYFQAASAGHAEAQYHLGLLFLAGKGVVESRKEAARWFRKASGHGHVEAKKALQSVEKRVR